MSVPSKTDVAIGIDRITSYNVCYTKLLRYQVIDKHRKKGGSRDPEINSIYFNIDGQTRRIVCKHKYWDNVRIGQRINVCIYESKINFDFISIDENE